MIDRRVLTLTAALVTAAFIIAGLPAYAQERQQPQLERDAPRLETQPRIQIDPRVLQRPDLRLQTGNIQFRAQFDERLLERAREMKLYRMERPAIDADVMRRVGADLGLQGETMRLGNLVGQLGRDTGFMMLDPETGRLAFNVNLVELVNDTPTDLPAEGQARQIAMEFLRQHGLMPDADQAVVTHVGRIRSAAFDPGTGQDSGPMDQALVVYFARQVDGFRVVGPGSTAVVQIGADGGGANGRIAGGGVQWAALGNPTELDPGQLHGVNDVMQAIRNTLSSEYRMANRIVVDRVGVFYHDAGGFLQPVVGFQAQINSNEFEYQYFGQVPLMQRPPVRVGPEPISREMREMLQQPPRDVR